MSHQLASEVYKILVAAAARIVFGDRLAEAGGFLELGVEVDRALHEIFTELGPQLAQNFARQLSARVVERRKHANQNILSAAISKHFERLHHLRQTMQAEEAGFDGNDRLIRGFESIER